ncbi:hypothetical protein AAFF_G00022120 [Aldrovandia affinis]|uniref:Uncharacterized protein n=1 Tax=Aldrovandia affinis TaxID=143900 RepID=A0AAD7S528_9TELE|nr:hypothetical protein AAFF_G00022120 [Aldrovandia affinis]
MRDDFAYEVTAHKGDQLTQKQEVVKVDINGEEVVTLDYLSLGRPRNCYPYLLVLTDLFSQYGWAVLVKDQKMV